jgi:hypothetical protein
MAIICTATEPQIFDSPEKFLKYYSKNKDEIDQLTTHRLNKQFTIEGYHLGRKNGILHIEPEIGKHAKYYVPKVQDLCELEHRVEALESKLTLLAEYITRSQGAPP